MSDHQLLVSHVGGAGRYQHWQARCGCGWEGELRKTHDAEAQADADAREHSLSGLRSALAASRAEVQRLREALERLDALYAEEHDPWERPDWLSAALKGEP